MLMSVIPPAVRVLPMSLWKEFPDYSDIGSLQQKYFLATLPNQQKSRYWYRERGLNAEPGTVVLFQSESRLIASATLLKTKRFTESERGYSGWLQFDPKSIRVFVPVDADQLKKFWPHFVGFSHVKHELDPAGYPSFERHLTDKTDMKMPQSIAEQILAAVVRLAGPSGEKEFSREEVRVEAGIDPERWKASFSPIFQGMRADQPGGAPLTAKYRKMFRQVAHGRHALTDHGRELLLPAWSADGPATAELARLADELDEEGYFSPSDQRDERKRQLRAVAERRGQRKFRNKLIEAYGGTCVVTDCNARPALEAAHILPYRGSKSDYVTNGLLLRCDIHTLFDLDLLGINPKDLTVVLGPSLKGTSYEPLRGRPISSPANPAHRPLSETLELRWEQFKRSQK